MRLGAFIRALGLDQASDYQVDPYGSIVNQWSHVLMGVAVAPFGTWWLGGLSVGFLLAQLHQHIRAADKRNSWRDMFWDSIQTLGPGWGTWTCLDYLSGIWPAHIVLAVSQSVALIALAFMALAAVRAYVRWMR